MTITTPPSETRRRGLRRGDDTASSARTARRTRSRVDGTEDTPVTGASARAGTAKGGSASPPRDRPAGKNGKNGKKQPPPRRRPPAEGRAPAKTTPGAPARRPARSASPARRAVLRDEPPRARTPFVLLVVGLLGGALVSLLLLNTVLAQDAFTLSQLQRDNRRLAERKQELEADIARESDPGVLRQKALGLGLVDSPDPAFIDARTGRVIEGGSPPPGLSDDAVAAAAAGGLTGAPGAIVPPVGGVAPQKTTGTQSPGTRTAATPRRSTRPGGGTR